MAYTPTNWANGETPINDVNLNKIEQGIVAVDRATTQNTADIATANTAIAQNTADIQTLINQGGSGGGGASTADAVSYDNASSGLTARNVQDALDELNDNVNNCQGGSGSNDVELTLAEYEALGDVVNSDNVNYFITDGNGSDGTNNVFIYRTVEVESGSIEANSYKTVSFESIDGYIPISCAIISGNWSNAFSVSAPITNSVNTSFARLENIADAPATHQNFTMLVQYIKQSAI